jgi:hypothetical protein
MTAIQKFLSTKPHTLTADQLAAFAEHWLLNEVPCQYCDAWVPRRDEPEYYEHGGIEVCDTCETKFQESRRSGKAGTPT